MREYGRLKSAFWRNPKMRSVSDGGKLLACYLISCPHGNAVGCFVLPYGYVAEDMNWDIETVRKRFAELLAKGFVERDEGNFLTRIVPWWEHNSVENPNVATGAVKDLEGLPSCELFHRLMECSEPILNRFERVTERVSKLLAKPFRNIEPSLSLALAEPERAANGFETVEAAPSKTEGAPPHTTNGVNGHRRVEAKGTRLPEDWQLTDERRAYAVEQQINPERTFLDFSQYWRAKAGAGARKADWDLTWQTWCRKDAQDPKKARAPENAPYHSPFGG